MKHFLLVLCCSAMLQLHAQRVIDVTKIDRVDQTMFFAVGGEPFVNVKFVNVVSGTPYFKDQWMKGKAFSADGNLHSGIFRLNLIDNELHFLNKKGEEMVATTKVKEILLTDTISNISYYFIHSGSFANSENLKKGWYMQLADGKASLFQFLNKQINETRSYGSATVEQRIHTAEEFYLLLNKTFVLIKKWKEAPAAFPDKRAELEDFLNTAASNFKTPAEKLIALVQHYNSL